MDANLLDAICGIPSETMGQTTVGALNKLIQTIDDTPNGSEQRLILFYGCFDKEQRLTALETLHFDKKTKRKLESALTK